MDEDEKQPKSLPVSIELSSEDEDNREELIYRVNDIPPLGEAIMLGFQQAMTSLSSLLVFPFLVSDVVCAGSSTLALRVSLISATFIASGIATLLQCTLGLRLSILHGNAFSFLPPLFAYAALPENKCTVGEGDFVEDHVWKGKLQVLNGSMMVACLSFFIFGTTGLVGSFAKHAGPITIVPVMALLALSTVPAIEEKVSLHWISIVQLCLLISFTIFLDKCAVPFPSYSFKRKKFTLRRIRIFSQFPYLLSIAICWIICLILTSVGAIPEGSKARTDSNSSTIVLRESPWIHAPYPGQFGVPSLSIALVVGYLASCLSNVIENVGAYKMAAKVSHEVTPPASSINRALIVEGIGSILAGSMGTCAGVTTFAENIALMQLTKVASRWTMQIAGIICICLGLFTKIAALLASLPEPLVGGVFCLGMSMIMGVALSNLLLVNLHKTRNLAIMGLAIMLGMVVPYHFKNHPLNTGNNDLDQIVNMLLSIQMLVGGVVAYVLDNVAQGVTRSDRGLPEEECTKEISEGYRLPEICEKLLDYCPAIRILPFLPSKQSINKCSS